MQGGTLSWYIKTDPGGPNDYNADVVLVSPGHILVNYGPDNATTDWALRSVTLTADAGWRLDNHVGDPASQQVFSDTLANLTGVYIRGEFLSGSETGYLDTVTLVPEPTAMSLLLLGIAALLSARR